MRQETSIINMSMFSAYEDLLNHSKWSEIFKLLCVSNPMGEWDLVLFQTSFFEFLNKKLIIVAHFSVLSKPNVSKKNRRTFDSTWNGNLNENVVRVCECKSNIKTFIGLATVSW